MNSRPFTQNSLSHEKCVRAKSSLQCYLNRTRQIRSSGNQMASKNSFRKKEASEHEIWASWSCLSNGVDAPLDVLRIEGLYTWHRTLATSPIVSEYQTPVVSNKHCPDAEIWSPMRTHADRDAAKLQIVRRLQNLLLESLGACGTSFVPSGVWKQMIHFSFLLPGNNFTLSYLCQKQCWSIKEPASDIPQDRLSKKC